MHKSSSVKSLDSCTLPGDGACAGNGKRFSSDLPRQSSRLNRGPSPTANGESSCDEVKTIFVDWSKYPKPNKPLPRLPRSPALPTTKPPSRTASPISSQNSKLTERRLPEVPVGAPAKHSSPAAAPQEPINFSEPPSFHAPRVPQQQRVQQAYSVPQQNNSLSKVLFFILFYFTLCVCVCVCEIILSSLNPARILLSNQHNLYLSRSLFHS